MKRTIKRYKLKESVIDKIQEMFLYIFIIIVGTLAVVGLFAITNARIERIENNQNIINK